MISLHKHVQTQKNVMHLSLSLSLSPSLFPKEKSLQVIQTDQTKEDTSTGG